MYKKMDRRMDGKMDLCINIKISDFVNCITIINI